MELLEVLQEKKEVFEGRKNNKIAVKFCEKIIDYAEKKINKTEKYLKSLESMKSFKKNDEIEIDQEYSEISSAISEKVKKTKIIRKEKNH